MKKTKDYTLVAIAVSNIVGCNCRRRSRGCNCRKKQASRWWSDLRRWAAATATAPSN